MYTRDIQPVTWKPSYENLDSEAHTVYNSPVEFPEPVDPKPQVLEPVAEKEPGKPNPKPTLPATGTLAGKLSFATVTLFGLGGWALEVSRRKKTD